MSILKTEQLVKVYGSKKNQQEVLKQIDMTVEKGEFISIMGASGSGKTTLLNVLSSIDYATNGQIEINGHQLQNMNNRQMSNFRKKELGFIFQEYNLLNTLTVQENIMLPLTIQNISKKEAQIRYEEISKALGILDIQHKYPSEISGGQKQRTSAARAFIGQPSIIFADEPTGALDSKSASDLLNKLNQMNQTTQSTIIMVTHDSAAASYSNRVIFLKDGKIYSELYKGDDDRETFYKEIIKTQSVLGGVVNEL
ncbi:MULTISPECIES: ABC transporter ATP-binding protein [Mammaliicoccus]|uniref:ABC transporter ATP-binding protein n=1 Tax=Mammaliicoccus vitulinus TaxID=71237 RepID=A0ABX7HBC5_9STAP|nr:MULTISPECIES: ABC transporter ATP-binding protein [Mammaliicoccus]HAL10103.1 ABC transporter ATP-binding protein [Staphylococcus sp.]MBM6628917.1 ABC transporter ATP-binding protein [Mammaliicoccus vitulinus]MBO3075995.1 ABC transporter ATP-binding protein [Mammaliicoccus vitulinus]MEB7658513.1 ABC transporter ATP-binding protein [Mammaliicoccus vitulinus]PNZ36364.1 ABC transporter ATP-binding protein [Mammaliicoccus vitulinus]